MTQDIHYLHMPMGTGKAIGVKKAIAWILGCLSGVLCVVLLIVGFVRRFIYKTDGDVQHSFAHREAMKRLAVLEKKGAPQAYSELESILIDYLSARTRIELNGLTLDRLREVLVEKKVGVETIDSICQFLDGVQAAGYAPSGSGARGVSDYVSELKRIITTLKGVL
jgi:hypothetical protein